MNGLRAGMALLCLVAAAGIGGCEYVDGAMGRGERTENRERPGKKLTAAEQAQNAAIMDVLNRVARRQIRELQDGDYSKVNSFEEAMRARPSKGIGWSYPWGVTLYGAQRSVDATGDREVEKFVLDHNAAVARNFAWVMSNRPIMNNQQWSSFTNNRPVVPVRGLVRLGHLDSCGAMGVEFLESMLRHPESVTADHRAVAERIHDWIANKQERLPDGTFWRPTSTDVDRTWKPGTIWIDDLYMGCPYLVRWGKFTNDDQYLHDTAMNVINMARRLQDKDGVWFHAYFENEQKHSPYKWGRANGWAMVATVEILSEMPENHPDRAALLNVLRRHIEGIKPLQAPSGMWRQVLDHPELWEETSCTAMFSYAIARAVNRGWIDAGNMAVARKGFEGLSKYVTAEGSVNGVCQGTNIGLNLKYYVDRPRPDDDLHGRGVVLLAGTEILEGSEK